MIELRTLGAIRLSASDGHDLTTSAIRPKRLALLAYLAAARPVGLHRRDVILGVFWPELDQARARHALSQSLHTIRRALGEGVVITRGMDQVGLDRTRLWCDCTAFEEAIDGGALEEALDLYKGDLLEGVFVSDAPAFERWLEDERARLRERAATAARALAEQCGREGRVTTATKWASRAAELDPLDERSLRRLMRARDRVGDRAGALLAYESFAQRLREELDVDPSPESRSLVDEIRSREELGATSTQERVVRTPRADELRLPESVAEVPALAARGFGRPLPGAAMAASAMPTSATSGTAMPSSVISASTLPNPPTGASVDSARVAMPRPGTLLLALLVILIAGLGVLLLILTR